MSSSASSARLNPAPSTEVRLSGVSAALDRRVNAIRGDIADIALAGRVLSPRYVVPVAMRCALVTATLHAEPDASSVCVTELLPGEGFAVFDRAGAWAWGQCEADGYVGWVRSNALVPAEDAPNGRVTALQALIFAGPSIKSSVVATLPLGSRIGIIPFDESFFTVGAGFLHRRFVDAICVDAVGLAHGFVGTPYQWGGRTRAGIDCSGLTQAVLLAQDLTCPRDSDQQLAAFPRVAFEDRRRGDLVAFPGHIGILVDADHLLHANAFHMTTLVEPLDAVVARLQPVHDKPISGVVRPPCRVSGPPL